jgi:selenoprotein W-related protein
VAEELKKAFNTESELVKGSGGIFEVIVDGKKIFSKKNAGRFPEEGEVAKLVKS